MEERDVLLHLQRFRARVFVIRQELSCAARKIRLVAQAVRVVWVLVRRSWLVRLVVGLVRQAVAVLPRARCADDNFSLWVPFPPTDGVSGQKGGEALRSSGREKAVASSTSKESVGAVEVQEERTPGAEFREVHLGPP